MGIFKKRNVIANTNDETLVMYSLGGDREAFCAIVTRYQSLLCSLAYSFVGDIKYSEDIAQEAFVEAWKKLDTLRDPEKLKSWLCGILRFKASHHRRKEANQAIKGAEEVEELQVADAENAALDEQAIQQQEQTLLWKALDGMEDTYREPLILFYREEQSVERVAAALDLSEDTVKQRLSRGRKLLKRAMSGVVESALSKSKPGVSFTVAVLAAISGIPAPAKAAAMGLGAAKTSSLFKLTSVLTLVAACSGLISAFWGFRASLDQSRTQNERKLAIKSVLLFMSFALIYVVGTVALKQLALSHHHYAGYCALAALLLASVFVLSYLLLVTKMFGAMRRLRAQERIFNPQAFLAQVDKPGSKQGEYKSALSLFGLPLCHFQFGMAEVGDKPAHAWIAGGSQAHGLLFAWGGVAIAPISVGIVSVGIISVGAVSFGLFSLGTVAIGIIGFGASAIAYKAYASLSAFGWQSAVSGGFSVAVDGAIGPIAYADNINNQQAAEIVNLALLNFNYQWILAMIAILVIVPAAWHAQQVRKRMKLPK
ncbi:RNA polymerase sigma factor [Paraglaciecola hydrolytica]|uniref:RNA polymerase sigma factor n=1 Tax=Paraglaciecola hydrolytica TaxID=1799789 RepID=A0A136A6Z1_9ALTE|nr:sigma-70 family RNA polymerase sigma factor [Paraglaciecola hydrolytica]KXI30974.1 RNA polymerase [Paraglaciecola hydrolytica]